MSKSSSQHWVIAALTAGLCALSAQGCSGEAAPEDCSEGSDCDSPVGNSEIPGPSTEEELDVAAPLDPALPLEACHYRDQPEPEADPACDLSGFWAGRHTTYQRAVGTLQQADQWYYFEIVDRGEHFEIVDHFDCQITSTGILATVVISRATTEAIMYRNSQIGRTGRFMQVDDHCEGSSARHYNVRGGGKDLLPGNFASAPELGDLPPLPTIDSPDGAEDWEEDGYPGVAFVVEGIGKRHSVQRDWNEWFYLGDEVDPAWTPSPIALNASDIRMGSRFDMQENVLAASDCGADSEAAACTLVQSLAVADRSMGPLVDLIRVGRCRDEPEVKAFLEGSDFDVCKRVREIVPQGPGD